MRRARTGVFDERTSVAEMQAFFERCFDGFAGDVMDQTMIWGPRRASRARLRGFVQSAIAGGRCIETIETARMSAVSMLEIRDRLRVAGRSASWDYVVRGITFRATEIGERRALVRERGEQMLEQLPAVLDAIERSTQLVLLEIDEMLQSLIPGVNPSSLGFLMHGYAEDAALALPTDAREAIERISCFIESARGLQAQGITEAAYTLAESGRYVADVVAAYYVARTAFPVEAARALGEGLARIEGGVRDAREQLGAQSRTHLQSQLAFLDARFRQPDERAADTAADG